LQNCTKTKIYDVHSKLRLILQSRVKYAAFVACQSYQRTFRDCLEMKFTSTLGVIQQAGAPETAAKSVTP